MAAPPGLARREQSIDRYRSIPITTITTTSPILPASEAHVARASSVSLSDLNFVIRAAGERTCEAAAHVLLRQLAELRGTAPANQRGAPVTFIHERPFSQAVRRTLEIGASSGRAWTIGMDADVLLTSDGVAKLVNMCRAAKPESFTVTGLMLCKFYGGFVFRGVHAYRSELLARALPLVGKRTPGGPDPDLKPESAVVHAMAARGFGYEGHPVVLAAHDYEQSYRHIYLKMRLRGRREVDGAAEGGDAQALLDFCRRGAASKDRDFLVAMWGIEDGIADAASTVPASRALCDWFTALPEFERRLAAAGMDEKEAFAAERGVGYAEQIIASHKVDLDTRTPQWIRQVLLQRVAA